MENTMEKIETAKKVLFWFESHRYSGKSESCPFEMTLQEAKELAEKELVRQSGAEQYIL